MKNQKKRSILIFLLGIITTAAVGVFLKMTIFLERPVKEGFIEDWGEVCLWPEENGIYAAISPQGCYSTTCTVPKLQTGTAIVNTQEYDIQLRSQFLLAKTSRFPLPCIDNCAGGGTVQFNLGHLIPGDYIVRFGDEQIGKFMVFSGRVTPRQCFENTP